MNQFKRQSRLLKQSEFQEISTNGVRKKFNSIRASLTKNDILISKLGMAVSIKVGGAIKRNYIRRRIREWFRNSAVKSCGFSIVISVDTKLFSLIDDKPEIGKIITRDLNLLENWLINIKEL